MTYVLLYSLKSAFVLFLLYLPYCFLLHRDSFFRFNRFVLLGILCLSVLLPFCNVQWLSLDRQPVVYAAKMQMVEVGVPVQMPYDMQLEVDSSHSSTSVSLFGLLAIIYIIGMSVVLALRLWQMARMRQEMQRGCLWCHEEDGITLYCHADRVVPFSWMRNIVINEQDYAEAGREIFLHEKGHISCRHSWDILLLTVVEMVQWWNPLVYLFGLSLRDVHEYEADDYVLCQGISVQSYQMLLIKKAIGYSSYTFANSFNHSLTKKRITMMKKEKSSPWMRSKVLYAIPMVALALSAFATPAIVNPIDGIVVNDEDKVKETSSNLQRNVVVNEKFVTNDSIYDVVQKFAEFPGGQKAFNEWMSENFQYPDSCMKEGIQGRVVLQFVVNTDGSIADVKPVRSPHPALTEAAIQIVKKMPRWIPAEHEGKKVRCRFNLPFMFRLSFDVEEASAVNDSVYNDAQKRASFPGGWEAFSKWMSENIQYPDSCMKEGIQGRVSLQFVVNTDGSIVDVEPLHSPHPALTEAAIQLVKRMPRWIPAENDGKIVRCRFRISISYHLSTDKSDRVKTESQKNDVLKKAEDLRARGKKLHELPADILIVMDDKPYEGSPKDLVMEDIESFAVLQKSSALTAQYGARAANGAILITTKAAKKGQVGK